MPFGNLPRLLPAAMNQDRVTGCLRFCSSLQVQALRCDPCKVYTLSHQEQLISQWVAPRELTDLILVLSSFLRQSTSSFKALFHFHEMAQITK